MTTTIIPGSSETLKFGRSWYQIHYTSETGATIYKVDPKTKKLKGEGPVFNTKKPFANEGWILFMVRPTGDAQSVARRIWPEVKKHLDAKSEVK